MIIKWLIKLIDYIERETWWRRRYKRITLSEKVDMWCEPDGNINHCKSDTYPLGEWFEVEHLSTNLKEPKVIIEDTYCG